MTTTTPILDTFVEDNIVISEQASTILAHRYFLKNDEGVVLEQPSGLFNRVAHKVASVENNYLTLSVEADLVEKDFFDIMSKFEFLPNSPTMMNAGTEQGTLSACFVLPLEDSMEGIMKAAHDAAMVQKFGGGTGFALSKLRPRGDSIKTTHGIACGPIEVLKTLSQVSSMITQGGKRDGANMAVMSVYHPDILAFINCKSVEGEIHNFNISVGVDSRWMECVKNNADYPLLNPHTNSVVKYINARDVFTQMVQNAWSNGEPGMVFLDRINQDNHVIAEYGEMIATNPCGEQPLLGNESCNLGSINLAKFFTSYEGAFKYQAHTRWEGQINWERLKKVTKTATRFLDNVIDANEYATPDIEKMTKATRKIGLGVMGFADLLTQLRIGYNTNLARTVGASIMSAIRNWSDEESVALGATRGTFPAWENSNFDRVTETYRNACRLTVAPTGTISMIADTSSGIEPTFALAWKKQNILEGKSFIYVNKYFETDAKNYGFYSEDLMDFLYAGGVLADAPTALRVPEWIKEVYVTSPEISPEDHVLMQASFQKYVDSGISKTINFSNNATIEDVEKAYMLAWDTHCKGITVYRAGSREKEVMVKGVKKDGVQSDTNNLDIAYIEADGCCAIPNIVMESGCETCKSCGWSACAIA